MKKIEYNDPSINDHPIGEGKASCIAFLFIHKEDIKLIIYENLFKEFSYIQDADCICIYPSTFNAAGITAAGVSSCIQQAVVRSCVLQ